MDRVCATVDRERRQIIESFLECINLETSPSKSTSQALGARASIAEMPAHKRRCAV